MIELTLDQRRELNGSTSVRARDPETNQVYVLIRLEVYSRLQALLEAETQSMLPLLADLSPEDWEDLSNYETKP